MNPFATYRQLTKYSIHIQSTISPAMARPPRRPKPQLTSSWATVESNSPLEEVDDFDDDPEEMQKPIPTPSSDAPASEDNFDGLEDTEVNGGVRRSSRRTSNRYSSVEPMPAPKQAAPAPKRATRQSSRAGTTEPEFIMPSLDHSSLGASWVKTTPPKVRARKSAVLSRSQHLPRKNDEMPPKTPQSPGKKRRRVSASSKSDPSSPWAFAWNRIISPVLGYLISLFGMVMNHLRPLIALVITAFVGIFVLQYLFSQPFLKPFTSAISIVGALSPCSVPIINLLPFCAQEQQTVGLPEFDQLITIQSAFEDVLASTAAGSTLPLDMKRSEASIRDLKSVVLYSSLPSKNELVFEFQGFVDTARQASGDLTRFNSRIGRAVDHIISTNRHTLQVLDGFALVEGSRGALDRFMQSCLPVLWGRDLTESDLLKQYLRHTGVVEEQIHGLIAEAQALLAILQNLDDRLDVIHGVVTRDGVNVKGNRDELFAQLWTRLGGNRGSVARLDDQLRLLREVAVYRKTAWAHVSATILKLQSIAAGLEDLRERVGLPEILGDDVPLRQHIETIQLGVERLERQREESRRVETDAHRRILDRKVPGEDRMIDAYA